MTAISLNLPTAKSSDAPGLPLDGLPKLNPGGTLPQAFAEMLGKAGKAATNSGGTPSGATADAAGPGTATGGDAEISPGATGVGADTAKAGVIPANGKLLPLDGLEIAANPATGETDGDSVSDAPTTDDAAEAEMARIAAETQSLVGPIALPGLGDGKTVVAGQAIAGAEHTAKIAMPVRTAGGNGANAQAATQISIQPDGQPKGQHNASGQDLSGGDTGRRGDTEGEQAARIASRRIAPESGAAAKAGGEAQQTGLSLQLRAADKPFATPESLQAGSLGNSTTTGSSAATTIAAALPGAPALGSAVGSPTQAGAMPHFPELAALVDRIAAARDSAGSASATIALAHKELGNLSLTFETSGRSLNVEVAAQDSDTQRSIAAAIAADRPQFRGGDGQQQANTQGLSAQANLGANAQGDEPGARQSGETGDEHADRGNSSRKDGNGQSGTPGQSNTDPKSDGGIYA